MNENEGIERTVQSLKRWFVGMGLVSLLCQVILAGFIVAIVISAAYFLLAKYIWILIRPNCLQLSHKPYQIIQFR